MKVKKFKAQVKIGDKVSTFHSMGDTEQDLIKKIKSAGLSLSHILKLEEVNVEVINQRGRPAAKY